MVGGKVINDYRVSMRKIVSILFVLLLIGTSLGGWPQHVVMGADSGTELVPNPGFEAVTDGKPDQWMSLNQDQDDLIEASTEEVYEGHYSVKLEDPSDTRNIGLRSDRIPVEPEAGYEASVYSY